MKTIRTHASVTVDGNTLFTLPANIITEGEHSLINIAIDDSQLNALLQVLRQEEHRQQVIKECHQAERIEKQANVLADELTALSMIQQVRSMMHLIVLPTIKSWRRQNQKEENQDETI